MNPRTPAEVGALVWITGLSGSGKTTLAQHLNDRWPRSRNCIMLDGDALRRILGPGIGHMRDDRMRLGLTYARLATMLAQQGVDAIVATVSMFEEVYAQIQSQTNACLVYAATPLSECARRDPKDIYKACYEGRIQGVAGVDLKVDIPARPDIKIESDSKLSLEASCDANVRLIFEVLNL